MNIRFEAREEGQAASEPGVVMVRTDFARQRQLLS
jgi:hypothetical protein